MLVTVKESSAEVPKTDIDDADVTCCSRLFQTWAVATRPR